MAQRFAKEVHMPIEDEHALEIRWLEVVVRSEEDPDEEPSQLFYLADAMGLCWLYLEDGSEDAERIQMRLLAQKLSTKAHHLLRQYEKQFSTYETWADRRHASWRGVFDVCRFPHRHYIFCLVPRKVLRSLREVVEGSDMMGKRFPVGLRLSDKTELRHLVVHRLHAAGLTHGEAASLLDPDGFAEDKNKATLSFRKLLKRGNAKAPLDKTFFSLVRPRTKRFSG